MKGLRITGFCEGVSNTEGVFENKILNDSGAIRLIRDQTRSYERNSYLLVKDDEVVLERRFRCSNLSSPKFRDGYLTLDYEVNGYENTIVFDESLQVVLEYPGKLNHVIGEIFEDGVYFSIKDPNISIYADEKLIGRDYIFIKKSYDFHKDSNKLQKDIPNKTLGIYVFKAKEGILELLEELN